MAAVAREMSGGTENIIALQREASSRFVYFTAALLLLHSLGFGGSLVYGGLTLPEHRKEAGQREFLFLTEEQGSTYMSIVPFLIGLGESQNLLIMDSFSISQRSNKN